MTTFDYFQRRDTAVIDIRETIKLATKTALLAAAKADAARCRNCPLWEHATQTVFGNGPSKSLLMLVGEQPGDKEDLAGLPFVGPAGHLLDKALGELGIERDRVYATNAVKHFKFQQSGNRRLHKSPAQREIEACRPWLLEEIEIVNPKLIVALGATAIRSLLQKAVPIQANRGKQFSMASDHNVLLTTHPSSLLRMPSADREMAYRLFLDDLAPIRALA